MAAITAEEREKFLQLMQDYNKSLENKTEVEVITADEMDDSVSMPGVKGSYDSVTGEFKPEKYVQAPMSAFAKPAKDAATELKEKIAAFEKAISDAETVLANMQTATEDARGIVKTATDAAELVRQTIENLKGVEVNAERLAQNVATADTLLQNLETAIQQAQTATSNANAQATHAKDEGDYAKQQGDYAKTQGDRVSAQVLDISKEKQAAIDAASNANKQASNAKSIYDTAKAWYDAVKPDWDSWYAATKKAWNDWFSDSLSTGVRKIWSEWFASIKSSYSEWFTAADTAEKGRADAESKRVKAEDGRVAAEKNRADAEAKRVAEMEELHQHPDIQGDNGNWWRWDMTTEPHQYVDTGILAKGGILYPSFEVDSDDLGLYMYGSSEETADSFAYDEGDGGMYYNPRKGKTT